ncbi:MAG: hypothetical protein IJU76_13925 [Desulfovibrionaceae bacterium]|nr:hypothetical protein [Desulfovibrionaceae bacterium]
MQYGWSGNGGYFQSVGARLLEWYNTQDDALIKYLFELGQLESLGRPGSERGGFPLFYTHSLTHKNHYVGTTEREIFSKINFIDYGYFYDSDKVWYYVIPGPFRIKIPLEVIEKNLNSEGFEFDFIEALERLIIKHMFEQYIKRDALFSQHLTEN